MFTGYAIPQHAKPCLYGYARLAQSARAQAARAILEAYGLLHLKGLRRRCKGLPWSKPLNQLGASGAAQATVRLPEARCGSLSIQASVGGGRNYQHLQPHPGAPTDGSGASATRAPPHPG